MASFRVVSAAEKKGALERWFVTGLALAMLAVAIAGFAPSIVHTAGRKAPLSPLAAAHGIVLFSWLFILLVQARLIATGNITLHRRVGMAASCVLIVMIPLAYATSISMVRRGFDLSGDLRIEHDPLYEFIFPFGDLLVFTVLVTTAIAYRRRPEFHKRLMLFANIALMGAPLAHFLGHIPQLAAMPAAIILVPMSMFLVSAVARDFLLTKKVHPLTLSLAVAMFLFGPLRAGLIGPSATWHRLASWLTQ